MTAIYTVILIVGMAVLGVPLVLNLLTPFAGGLVERLLPESSWDGAMLLFAQGSAAILTLLIGRLFGLPWISAIVAAVVVGITTYSRRAQNVL